MPKIDSRSKRTQSPPGRRRQELGSQKSEETRTAGLAGFLRRKVPPVLRPRPWAEVHPLSEV